eukprot:31728_1
MRRCLVRTWFATRLGHAGFVCGARIEKLHAVFVCQKLVALGVHHLSSCVPDLRHYALIQDSNRLDCTIDSQLSLLKSTETKNYKTPIDGRVFLQVLEASSEQLTIPERRV